MSPDFDAGPPAARIMRGTVADLEKAESGPPNGVNLFRDAVEGLFMLQGRIACGDIPSDQDLRRFRERVGGLLMSGHNPANLSRYTGRVLKYAQRGRLDGYESACWGRSALQVLRDDFAEWDLFDDLTNADLEEIDEELEDAAEDAPPIRNVPSWVPESHWWWRAPKRTDMSDEERLHRLYGGDLDDVHRLYGEDVNGADGP